MGNEKKRSGVKQATRTRILTRDESLCQKCGRLDPLQIHHIQAAMDDGPDDDDNLITLCTACHREWGLAETVMDIPFTLWLQMPPYIFMFNFFTGLDRMEMQDGVVSIKDLRAMLKDAQYYVSMCRSDVCTR